MSDVPFINRRTLAKSIASALFFSASTLKRVTPLSIFAIPQRAQAEYITAILAVVGAVSAMTNKGNGAGQALSALNLKLDQVLENQKLLIRAIDSVQQAIGGLPDEIRAAFTNEAYLQSRETAGSLFERTLTLLARESDIEKKVSDFNVLFEDAYIQLTLLLSRFRSRETSKNGVNAIIDAGRTMLLHTLNVYALANFEMTIPAHLRWKNEHELKLLEMCRFLRESLDQLTNTRCLEAYGEQVQKLNDAFKDKNTNSWGPVLDQMYSSTDLDVPRKQVELTVTFYSDISRAKLFWKGANASRATPGRPFGQLIMAIIYNLSLDFKYDSLSSGNWAGTVFSELKISSQDTWENSNWGKSDVSPTPRDLMDWTQLTSQETSDGTVGAEEVFDHRRKKLSIAPHEINTNSIKMFQDENYIRATPSQIYSQFVFFNQALERHGLAVSNQKIILDLQSSFELMHLEIKEFELNIANAVRQTNAPQ